jgi:hypothetical protein
MDGTEDANKGSKEGGKCPLNYGGYGQAWGVAQWGHATGWHNAINIISDKRVKVARERAS